MAIDTLVKGNPVSIRGSAAWLGNSLSPAIEQSVTDLFKIRDEAEAGWSGDAGSAFHATVDAGGRNALDLAREVERISEAFKSYADDLDSAQRGMERARQIAGDGGLALVDDAILDPGQGPARPAEQLPAGATTVEAQVYEAEVAFYNDHQAKLAAYAEAQEHADSARDLEKFAQDTLGNVLGDLKSKPALVAAGAFNDAVIGGLAEKHVSILKAQSAALRKESALAAERYLKAPGGSAEAKALNKLALSNYLEASEWELKAMKSGSKIGARLPIIGLGITAADIGYDIHTGKPVGKAVISGVGGALAAAGAGAAIGSIVPGAGTLVGAGAGLLVGLVVSGGLDAGYDRLPQGTKDAIEDGFAAVGHGLTDAGGAVVDAGGWVGDRASDLGDSAAETVSGAGQAIASAGSAASHAVGETVSDSASKVWKSIF
ncbi:hypothetical protein GCM10022223_43110 [Kineosporia mesophila]|uniref:WXG100 family type VII secretion target n=1 Tax=Kineosporia mesophila TaxID=566012 RepID=A0ABP6ZX32_9ACTN|nr:WXG100 family type VII secretion target [Kineosporia mesophila]MCD5353252.1 WXG100 family type VII secretion target [Kineosporia mesophila]